METWLIITIIACGVLVPYIVLLTVFKKQENVFKLIQVIGAIALLILFALAIILIPTSKEKYEPLSSVGMYLSTIALVLIAGVLVWLFGKDADTSSTKALTYGGIMIALAFGLSYIKLFSLPQGGSITLVSMLPIILYSYLFGAKRGVVAGLIYGILQLIQSPQIYQSLQVLLDYPIAFGLIGIAGITRNFKFLKGNMLLEFSVGASIACIGRYLAHFLSGYFVFSSWAMDGYSALGWSLVYNLYIVVELALILVVGVALFISKSFQNEIKKRLY